MDTLLEVKDLCKQYKGAGMLRDPIHMRTDSLGLPQVLHRLLLRGFPATLSHHTLQLLLGQPQDTHTVKPGVEIYLDTHPFFIVITDIIPYA